MSRHDLQIRNCPNHLNSVRHAELQSVAYEILNHDVTGGAAQRYLVAENQKPGMGNLISGGPLDAPII